MPLKYLRRLGLPEYIIESSKKHISKKPLKFEDLIQSLQQKSIKAERDARVAERLKLEAEKMKEKLEEKLAGIDKIRENAQSEAKKEAKQILKSKRRSRSNIKEYQELEKMGYFSEARQMLKEVED